jgi:uncharacterized protein (DUF4213/DUF364 family)
MWEIYDAIVGGIPECHTVERAVSGDWWTLVRSDTGNIGLAMTTPHNFITPLYPGGIMGMKLHSAAAAVKSWNLNEAGFGMAAANAWYNTPERAAEFHCGEPYENYCTRGIDFTDKTVGIVGHLKYPQSTFAGARKLYILERHPQEGDYPDSACEYLLPQCDVAIITGSSLVNKTLPRLLELCHNAYTILTGPTVPLCPPLLKLGVDRLAGMIVTDCEGLFTHVASNTPGPPFRFGSTFLLEGNR